MIEVSSLSDDAKKGEDKSALCPPLALVGLMAVLFVIASWSCWSISVEADYSFVWAGRYDEGLSVLVVRLMCFVIAAHRMYYTLYCAPTLPIDLRYIKGSRFRARRLMMGGSRRLCTFTVQSWALETIYFGVGVCACVFKNQTLSLGALLLFETCFATAHLVSAVTAFVLLPTAAKVCATEGTLVKDHILLAPQALWLHNANVLLLHADLFVSNQKLLASHLGGPIFWALWYIAFAWVLAIKERFVMYPFIDFTIAPSKSVPFHFGLALVLVIFFLVGVSFDTILHNTKTRTRLLAHIALLSLVTRFSVKQLPKPLVPKEVKKPKEVKSKIR